MWRPQEVEEVFAQRSFTLVRGRRRQQVLLRIGRPVKGPHKDDPWWCPIHLGEPFDKFQAVAGEDSMQCLVLALQLVQTTLPTFARNLGGQAEWLGERERLIFADTDLRMLGWISVANLVDALSDSVAQLEERTPASKALLARLRLVVARQGAGPRLRPTKAKTRPAAHRPKRR